MLRRLSTECILALGRLTGRFAPRPRNLIVVPESLGFSKDAMLAAVGRDLGEVVSGCGGALCQHREKGGEAKIMVPSPPGDLEVRAAAELGLARDDIIHGVPHALASIPADALLFFPFSLGPHEGHADRIVPRASGFFYESDIPFLPECEVPIDEFLARKLKALTLLGKRRECRLAHALSAYRSSATRGGKGWCESFLSFETAAGFIHTFD